MKRIILMGLVALMLGLMITQSQADLIQCPNGGCNGTDNSDIINGSPEGDFISGLDGDDIIFGNDGNDELQSGNGNDLLFGGNGSDFIFGGDGNDILLPGPDGPLDFAQIAGGEDGNDTTNVFAGEITGCLHISDVGGNDTANLIGFGPYSAQKPYGQSDFGDAWILVLDPITGGVILIRVHEDNDFGVETINGLPSPNVTITDIVPEACDTIVS